MQRWRAGLVLGVRCLTGYGRARRLSLSKNRNFARSYSVSSELNPISKSPYTTDMDFIQHRDFFPVYQVMDKNGDTIPGASPPDVSKEQTIKMYDKMVRINVMDKILYDAQRQGRISFYMTSSGEEATHIGSAAPLSPEDIIYAQYREPGVLMWRGYTFAQFIDQCLCNKNDLNKGRQMPVHYGSRELNYHTISSPLGTQIPQAAGAGYKLKLDKSGRCTVCYFGDGAASEGDFHPALNFAATLKSQTIFFVRNNGYAISTSSDEQYAGDGIAARGPAYGIKTIRVDGNDIWAVYNAMERAREICVGDSEPVLIEAMTYRIGHHSTSDDSTRYREKAEIEAWQRDYDPITRLRNYMQKEERQWWTDAEDEALRKNIRKEVLATLRASEKLGPPSLDEVFTDVYDDVPPHLIAQNEEMLAHVSKYPDHYKAAH
eukprot:TRINITY_DN6930_c0_g1_i1.p1 TRINITY_DN6930_c0_g1~~TRINITY_DN6930_c0_g1_i1.p1  ORF type:complete len:432 (+),score=73.51 TRINITY_DN6930_c0_g1_i1:94-1389(+)